MNNLFIVDFLFKENEGFDLNYKHVFTEQEVVSFIDKIKVKLGSPKINQGSLVWEKKGLTCKVKINYGSKVIDYEDMIK